MQNKIAFACVQFKKSKTLEMKHWRWQRPKFHLVAFFTFLPKFSPSAIVAGNGWSNQMGRKTKFN